MANTLSLIPDIISKELIMLVAKETRDLMTEKADEDDVPSYRSTSAIGEPTATYTVDVTPDDVLLKVSEIADKYLSPIARQIIAEIRKNPAATFHRLDRPAAAYQCAVNQYRGLWVRVLPMYDGISDDIVFRVDISHS